MAGGPIWVYRPPSQTRRRRVALKVSGNTTVLPGAGSLVFTGYAPTATTGNTVAPGAGSLVFTGFAPSANEAVLPGAGSIAFNGFAPTVAAGNTVAPGAGSVTFNGFAPTVTAGLTVAPGAGSVTLTGYAPRLDEVVFPGAGSISFTGLVPSIDQTTQPGAGSVVFTGFAPSVSTAGSPITVAPGVGAVVFTGYAPSVAAPRIAGGAADKSWRQYLDWQKRHKKKRREPFVERPQAPRLEPEVAAAVSAPVAPPLPEFPLEAIRSLTLRMEAALVLEAFERDEEEALLLMLEDA